jgi:hypothetical protein
MMSLKEEVATSAWKRLFRLTIGSLNYVDKL